MFSIFFFGILGGANYGIAVVRFPSNLWCVMKILNLKTNNIFNLPNNEAKKLLEEFPDEFSKSIKPKKNKKESVVENDSIDKDSILPQIVE